MPNIRSARFGEALGGAIERGAMSISQGIQARYLAEAKRAQAKADRAWEEAQTVFKGLMQQGYSPEVAQAIGQPGFQQAYRAGVPGRTGNEPQFYQNAGQRMEVPSKYTSPLVQAFEEQRTRITRGKELGLQKTEAEIGALKAPKTFFMYDVTGKPVGTIEAPRGTQAIGLPAEKTAGGDAQLLKDTAKLQGLSGTIDYMEKVLIEIPTGRIKGQIGKGQALVGQYPQVTAYEALRQANIGPVARVISGEVGVLTDRDINRAEDMLPKVTDTPAEVKLKIKQMRDLLKIRMAAVGKQKGINEKQTQKTVEERYAEIEEENPDLSDEQIRNQLGTEGY